ncbi:hypothetical protein [Nostoc sp.]
MHVGEFPISRQKNMAANAIALGEDAYFFSTQRFQSRHYLPASDG